MPNYVVVNSNNVVGDVAAVAGVFGRENIFLGLD
jgi:hypothetical protein